MSGSTTRLGLYLAGGGSSEEFEDEVIDIDRQNGNFEKIDAVFGAPTYTSASRPSSPKDGQLIWETDTGKIMRFRALDTQWHEIISETLLPYVQETEPDDAPVGALWFW